MFENAIYKIIKPYGKERIVKIIRPSLWSRFWLLFGAIFFILMPFFFLYPLFNFGKKGLIFFAVFLMIGLILLVRFFVIHYLTALILTTSRLVDVDRKSFFSRSVTEVLYDKIQNVSFKSRGFFKSIMGLGDVYVDLVSLAGSHSKTRLKFISLKNPESVCGEITFWQRRLVDSAGKRESKAVYLLEKIRRKVGEKTFTELIQN